MLKMITFTALALIIVTGAGSVWALDLDDENIRTSYSIGYKVGRDFVRQGKDINPELVVQGVMDALEGGEPLITLDEMRRILTDFKKEIVASRNQKVLKQAQKNLETGVDFLARNGKKEGVRTLPSGLQYKILKAGKGKSPGATDTVSVHYRGIFIDGTEFDSSYNRGKPATFKVAGVIAGWTQALQLMKEGGRWQLFIPPELAYRDTRSGPIEPNSTLVFEVELLSVEGR